MKHLDYVDLWRTFATKLKAISHTPENPQFVRFNIEELTSSLKSKINLDNMTCLLESYETSVDDKLSDNLRDIKTGGVWFIKKCQDHDFDKEDITLSECEAVYLKAIAWLRHQKKNNTGIKHIDLGSINVQKVGPIWDKCFGYRMDFRIDESLNANVVYDANDYYP